MSALDPNQGPPFYHCWAGLYGGRPAGWTTLGNAFSRPRPGHSACSSCSGQDGSRLSPPGASPSNCSREELARGRLGLPTVKARRATSGGQLGTPPFPAPPGLVCPHAGWAGSPRTGPGPSAFIPKAVGRTQAWDPGGPRLILRLSLYLMLAARKKPRVPNPCTGLHAPRPSSPWPNHLLGACL